VRFVYARHGRKVPGQDTPLTEAGREQARRAGAFLRDQGIVPDWLCHTATLRTRETAERLLAELGVRCPVHRPESGWRRSAGPEEIAARIARWASAAPRPVQTLLFVGHEHQQDALVAAFGFPPVPDANRGCVLVLAQDGSGRWGRGPSWLGSA
jgi:phosphohistidine phosphatase